MRIVIFGGAGMLGHRLWMELSRVHDVWIAIRGKASGMPALPNVDRSHIREGVDALDFDSVIRTVASLRPDLAINCIGLIKQHPLSADPLSSIEINARLPHRLSLVCHTAGIRMIHISTDCVFSGSKGKYTEDDIPDPEDLYGRTKLLGEVAYPHTVTLRTSLIGRELRTHYGLAEWFLGQKQTIKGHVGAIFSGFTTQAFAAVLLHHVIPISALSGVYHASSEPISKYDLLMLMNEAFGTGIEIRPDSEIRCDRSLDSSRFRAESGFVPSSWREMIREMASDTTPYDRWGA
jgi:dTDP-4-dehydrorhamnose reductase